MDDHDDDLNRKSRQAQFFPNLTRIVFVTSLVLMAFVTQLIQLRTKSETTFIIEDDLLTDLNIRATSYASLTENQTSLIFNHYISRFNKKYHNSTETATRFQKFKQGLSKIDERNKREKENGGTAQHGITIFSDLSDEEFRSMYLVARPTTNISNENRRGTNGQIYSYKGDEDYVTWEGVYTNEVHDQGYCGSCWAYSVTQQMEADAIRLGLISYHDNLTLSAEQVLTCDTRSYGCSGGWTETAYQYIITTGGVALESSYPYSSYYSLIGECMEQKEEYFMTIDGYYLIETEEEMINYVKTTGPLSACVDATEWLTYQKGIVSVCGKDVNHCVQITGVDTSEKNGFWKVRNTWSTLWGEDGYIRLSIGENTCNIANDPTFTEPWLLKR